MNKNETVSKCHDIQVSLGMREVPDYEKIPMIGMMINLAIHLEIGADCFSVDRNIQIGTEGGYLVK